MAEQFSPVPSNETGNTYVFRTDRFVVSLLVGYDGADAHSPKEAAAMALSLTREVGSNDTQWYVHDRRTGVTHCFEQSEFDDLIDPESGGYVGPTEEG